MAALFRHLKPRETAQALVRLRFSNAQVDRIAKLASDPHPPEPSAGDADFRRWLSRVRGREAAVTRLALAEARARGGSRRAERGVVRSWCRAKEVRRTQPPLCVSDLAVNGRSLIRLGLTPGPHFKEILEHLLARVLEDPGENEVASLEREAHAYAATLGETSRGRSGPAQGGHGG